MNKKNNIDYKNTKIMLNSICWTTLLICFINIMLFAIGIYTYRSTNNIDYQKTIFAFAVRSSILETILTLLSIVFCQYIVHLYERNECNKLQNL